MKLTYGVHSEAGKLRRVLVHSPGAAMARLTPANCAELLFDDVIWVKQARIEHMTFVDAMRNRGVEVVFLQQMLAETLDDMEARRWLLEARVSDNSVGVGLADIPVDPADRCRLRRGDPRHRVGTLCGEARRSSRTAGR